LTEQILKKYLKVKYGEFKPVRLTGGYTNATFLLNGTNLPLVVKVANSFNKDIKNEINCLKITQNTGVVPKFYDFMKQIMFN
jgi:predicted Ser/Thr protein kinase